MQKLVRLEHKMTEECQMRLSGRQELVKKLKFHLRNFNLILWLMEKPLKNF